MDIQKRHSETHSSYSRLAKGKSFESKKKKKKKKEKKEETESELFMKLAVKRDEGMKNYENVCFMIMDRLM